MIYGTIGPACRDRAILRDMFREGMNGVRLNLSHSTLDKAAGLIEACRMAACECGIQPELMIDMQGPELRTGRLEDPVRLDTEDLVSMENLPFPEAVKKMLSERPSGQEVLLDDGKILLKTEALRRNREVMLKTEALRRDGDALLKAEALRRDGDVVLRVIRGGILESRKSIALPGCQIRMPSMTDDDREQIGKAKRYGVTAVMQPFVRCREDLIEVRSALDQAGCQDIRLLAKIENMEGIRRLKELIPYCDEIVIARGDLGNAMELWELPAAQKRISALCREAGRNFMVVTQMLDSMTHRQIPTRAEVSDIFNAVLDGAASVMVTGETAVGEYPVLVIRYLSRTVREAEIYSINMLSGTQEKRTVP